jgi:O-antigen ligase
MIRLPRGIAGGNPVWLGALGVMCLATGIVSGVQPKLGLELAFGLGFTAAVLGNLILGLCLFTVLSFLEVINLGGAALSVSKVAGLLLFLSLLASVSTGRTRESRGFLTAQPLLAWSTIAFLSWSVVSIVWAGDRSAATTSTQRFVLNALLLPIVFIAVRNRRQLLWVIGAFVIGGAASAAYGFLGTVSGRLTGAIGDPNLEASVLVATIALAIGLSSTQERGSARRVWIAIGGAVAMVGFLGTLSRGGLVAASAVLVSALVLGGRWRAQAGLAVVMAVAVTGLYLGVVASNQAKQHVISEDSTGRSDLWKVGLKMFEAQPFTGVGSGNFQSQAYRYVESVPEITRADLIVAEPHVAHNTYLEAADDLGVPGLIFLVGILFASLRAGMQAANRYGRAGDLPFELLSRTVVLALIGTLAADVFIVGQYNKQLWLLLALPPVLLALAPGPSADA